MTEFSTPAPSKPALTPTQKMILEVGPLMVFLIANQQTTLVKATGIFMATTFVALVIHYYLTRHVPFVPVVSALVVGIFGGLTVYFEDDLFIKLKPTIVNVLFGLILMGSLILKKPVLSMILGPVFKLDEVGWRKFTLRWALFFFFLAIVNELVWRTQSADFWVKFKVFGFMPLTFLFMATQMPLLKKHKLPEA